MASKSRKHHAPITDTDSDESITASQSQSSVPKKPYVPRFLINHSEVEGKDISLLSLFLIHKTIMSMAGEPKSIKNLRSGDLFIYSEEKFIQYLCFLIKSTILHISLSIYLHELYYRNFTFTYSLCDK